MHDKLVRRHPHVFGDADGNIVDVDGSGDVCDCAPADPAVTGPAEVSGLSVSAPVSGTAHVVWTAVQGADDYGITRGSVSTLTGGDYGSCLAQGITGTSYDDVAVPAPGTGFAYLSQARSNVCGWGSLGNKSTGQPRVNNNPAACP